MNLLITTINKFNSIESTDTDETEYAKTEILKNVILETFDMDQMTLIEELSWYADYDDEITIKDPDTLYSYHFQFVESENDRLTKLEKLMPYVELTYEDEMFKDSDMKKAFTQIMNYYASQVIKDMTQEWRVLA
jgi:hypothetical protein